MTKIIIGWTVLNKDGKAVGQAESRYGSRLSHLITPVYNSIGKARSKATRSGRSYDDVVEVFVEVPHD